MAKKLSHISNCCFEAGSWLGKFKNPSMCFSYWNNNPLASMLLSVTLYVLCLGVTLCEGISLREERLYGYSACGDGL